MLCCIFQQRFSLLLLFWIISIDAELSLFMLRGETQKLFHLSFCAQVAKYTSAGKALLLFGLDIPQQVYPILPTVFTNCSETFWEFVKEGKLWQRIAIFAIASTFHDVSNQAEVRKGLCFCLEPEAGRGHPYRLKKNRGCFESDTYESSSKLCFCLQTGGQFRPNVLGVLEKSHRVGGIRPDLKSITRLSLQCYAIL